jgi:small subunit ribosomal protein S18
MSDKEVVKESPSLKDVFDESAITETKEDTSGGENYGSRGKKKRRRKKRVDLNLKCPLCESNVKFVTYKDVYQLKKFTSVRGKIISPEKSGMCAKHQRQLTRAIKRARFIALLPYVAADTRN